MELEFDVKVTAGALYDYLLYHTYTSFSGMLGTIAGVLILIVFASTKYPTLFDCRYCFNCILALHTFCAC